MNRYSIKKGIIKFNGVNNIQKIEDHITAEEPMEIRICNDKKKESVSVVMRTPIDDFSLAVGFLFDEGILDADKFIKCEYEKSNKQGEYGNIVNVYVSGKINSSLISKRNFYVNSSCGVCGKTNIDEVFLKTGRLIKIADKISPEIISSLPEKMRENQIIFRETGGIHSAALFDYKGNLLEISEDIGRHNAVDKTIGKLLMKGIKRKEDSILQVSGRCGFEIVQKASMFGISVISSISAPSSLAIDMAETFNITLISFVRENHFNIYTGSHRILNA